MKLRVGAGIVMIPKLFIWNREICHGGFNFYLSLKKSKEIEVITAVRRNLRDKIIMNNITKLVYHPYFIFFEIRELDMQSKKLERETQVVNAYENQRKNGCIWNRVIWHIRTILEDVDWEPIV